MSKEKETFAVFLTTEEAQAVGNAIKIRLCMIEEVCIQKQKLHLGKPGKDLIKEIELLKTACSFLEP
jgi:hypothetical protein